MDHCHLEQREIEVLEHVVEREIEMAKIFQFLLDRIEDLDTVHEHVKAKLRVRIGERDLIQVRAFDGRREAEHKRGRSIGQRHLQNVDPAWTVC